MPAAGPGPSALVTRPASVRKLGLEPTLRSRSLSTNGDRRGIETGRNHGWRGRIERQEHRRAIRSHRGDDPCTEDLGQGIPAHRERVGAAQQIPGNPELGLPARQRELLRDLDTGDRHPGVDAADECGADRLDIGPVARPLLLHVASVLHAPSHGVAVQEVHPQHFGEPPLHRSTPQIHLKEPILRLDKSLSEEQVVLGLGVDVRDAPPIAHHAHGGVEAGDRHRARYLRDSGERLLAPAAAAEQAQDRREPEKGSRERHARILGDAPV
jgi:hypothetical protein